jgi:hypothetical protein
MSSYLTTSAAASTYAVIAAGQPVAGSTGQVLTKNSGTSWDSSWSTPVVGDRYLTSSTTSNTLSNTNKTFTIGTGLSYTPTQNITISYDASNHMHGEVLTYNSGTGVLTVDINNHTGAGTYAAWVVNVGGVTPATSVAFADITGAVSGNANLQAALDLKADLASPTFSGSPSLPTGTIGTTQSPGNNTTALATTAFVTAAVPAFATAAQTVTGTSATTALNPSLANFAFARGMHTRFDGVNTTSISGNGAVTTGYYNYREMYTSTTLSVGRAAWFLGVYAFSLALVSSRADSKKIDFSKKIWLYGRFGTPASGYLGDANTILYITLGGYTALATGAMTSLGIGLSKVGGVSSFINLIVHNGTSQTNVATSKTLTATQITDYVIYSDGAGNVTLFLDGVQAATTSAGPTGITATAGGFYREQVESTISATVRQVMHCFGGGIIIDG